MNEPVLLRGLGGTPLSSLYVGPFEQSLAGSPVSLSDIEAPDFDKFPGLRSALAQWVSRLERHVRALL